MNFKNVTLEMSLKPFKKTDDNYMRNVIKKMFDQWRILTEGADEISVLLWTSDGSEILEYSGDLDATFEWAHYLGLANKMWEWNEKEDPARRSLSNHCYDYIKDVPTFTYETLKKIVKLIKEVGRELYPDKSIRVGETFDPGPEFAKSNFKYNTHPECCKGGTLGSKSFVCGYTTLNGDDRCYAGYPDGIPDGLSFATFFGRQSQHFLTDMGFDYLWLSNGFGFGMEPWASTGAIFDGKGFDVSRFDEIKKLALSFWTLFRKECPDFRIETRGTNLSTGIDLATDGVPLKDIYEGNFNLLPPPNSPWAALNGDFGLELTGYMSRIAQLPDDRYLFRYYVHDPWWINSPWADRYEGLPHDIYLPMAVCRIDNNAAVKLPTHINILSVDNSFGDLPDFCAYEPSVHIKKALRYAPDKMSPILWVYPFDEYHSKRDEKSVYEMFFGDWFIRGAINHGFPLSSVVSTTNFVEGCNEHFDKYIQSILVSTIPEAGSEYEKAIMSFIENGGRVMFYGSVDRASEEFLKLVNVKPEAEDSFDEMTIKVDCEPDTIVNGQKSSKILHRSITCGGGVNTKLADTDSPMQPFAFMGDCVVATASDRVVWLKGTCSAAFRGGHLLDPDNENEFFSGESLMRYGLKKLGYEISFTKQYANSKEPVIMLHRHQNAYMFSVCAADTTVKTHLTFPLGAPIMVGGETVVKDNCSTYCFDKAVFKECRVFVEQEDGIVACHDIAPGSVDYERRIKLTGLQNATIRFFAPEYCKDSISAVLRYEGDPVYLTPLILPSKGEPTVVVGDKFDYRYVTDENGTYFEAKNISGTMIICVPYEEPVVFE